MAGFWDEGGTGALNSAPDWPLARPGRRRWGDRSSNTNDILNSGNPLQIKLSLALAVSTLGGVRGGDREESPYLIFCASFQRVAALVRSPSLGGGTVQLPCAPASRKIPQVAEPGDGHRRYPNTGDEVDGRARPGRVRVPCVDLVQRNEANNPEAHGQARKADGEAIALNAVPSPPQAPDDQGHDHDRDGDACRNLQVSTVFPFA